MHGQEEPEREANGAKKAKRQAKDLCAFGPICGGCLRAKAELRAFNSSQFQVTRNLWKRIFVSDEKCF